MEKYSDGASDKHIWNQAIARLKKTRIGLSQDQKVLSPELAGDRATGREGGGRSPPEDPEPGAAAPGMIPGMIRAREEIGSHSVYKNKIVQRTVNRFEDAHTRVGIKCGIQFFPYFARRSASIFLRSKMNITVIYITTIFDSDSNNYWK